MLTFSEKVKKIVHDIPKGKVMTYGAVAKKAGNARAARAVGSIMKKNYVLDIPCHRVIPSSLRVGAYNRGGLEVKVQKLRAEGVGIEKEKVLPKFILQ